MKRLEAFLRTCGDAFQSLIRDKADAKYWSEVLGMAGAACLAVAFIETNGIALCVGILLCLYGLRLSRQGRQ